MRRWLRNGLKAMAVLGLVVVLCGWVFVETLDLEKLPQANRDATAADIDFLRGRVHQQRGRILAVVTSTATFSDGKRAGYELTELSRAYWVFVANGYAVDIASPTGGEPTMVLDTDDVTDADYAFLNDDAARRQLAQTLPLGKADPADYAAIYFVGGKGAMFDFPGNADIARLVQSIDGRGGIVGAVCHGPAAFVGLQTADGEPWLQGRQVTAFTNAEELFLMKDARQRFDWLLQDELVRQGARFDEAPLYLGNVVVDGRLITGQNPWSTWAVAEAMVRALGHVPVPRGATGEEVAVALLHTYHREGFAAARAELAAGPVADRRLLLMHALVASMQRRLIDAWQLQRLARLAA